MHRPFILPLVADTAAPTRAGPIEIPPPSPDILPPPSPQPAPPGPAPAPPPDVIEPPLPGVSEPVHEPIRPMSVARVAGRRAWRH